MILSKWYIAVYLLSLCACEPTTYPPKTIHVHHQSRSCKNISQVNKPHNVPIASLAPQQKHKMKTAELTSPFVMVDKTSSPSNGSLGYIIVDDTNLPLEESDGLTVFVSGDKMSQSYKKGTIWYLVLETSSYFIENNIVDEAREAVSKATANGGWKNEVVRGMAPHASLINDYITPQAVITTSTEDGHLVYVIRASQIDDKEMMNKCTVEQVCGFFMYAKEVHNIVANDRSAKTGRMCSVLFA